MSRWWRFGAGAVVVLLIATVVVSRVAGDDPGMPGFRLAASADQGSYAPGEPVELSVRVCRTGPWPVRTTSGGGSNVLVVWEVVDDAGEVVADTSHRVYTMELRTVLWLPGQCRSVVQGWDQHHWSHPDLGNDDAVLGVPVVGDRAEPGTYRFVVTWLTTPFGEEGGSTQTPIPVPTAPFELLP